MVTTSDVIVVGGGVYGCAAAWAYARRGRRVVLLERQTVASGAGTSHGSRNLGVPWAKPPLIPAARFALSLWREVERAANGPLLRWTGHLDVAAAEAPGRDALESTLTSYGAGFERLSGRQVSERFAVSTPPDADAFYLPGESAVGRGESLMRALVEEAVRHGANVHEQTIVTSIAKRGSGLIVETDRGTHRAAEVILAIGPRAAGDLFPRVGIRIEPYVTAEQVVYLRGAGAHRPKTFPMIEDTSLGAPGFYVIPEVEGAALKVGQKGTGPRTAFTGLPGTLDEDRTRRILDYARRLLGDPCDVMTAEPCFYTLLAPRFHTVVIPSSDDTLTGVFAITGCSGSGFKLAPAVALALASRDSGEALPFDASLFFAS